MPNGVNPTAGIVLDNPNNSYGLPASESPTLNSQSHVFDPPIAEGSAIFVDVRTKGVFGTGIADDTQGLLDALDDVRSAGGGIVFIPSNFNCRYDTTLEFDAVNTALWMAPGAQLSYDGTDIGLLVTASQHVDISGGKIINIANGTVGLEFAYDPGAPTGTGFRYSVSDFWIEGFNDDGLYAKNIEKSTFHNVVSINNGGYGIRVDNSLHTGSIGISNIWTSCRAQENGLGGWWINNDEASWFVACQAFGNTGGVFGEQFRIGGSARMLNVVLLDVENPQNGGAGPGLYVSGLNHSVSIAGYSLDKGIQFNTATGCTVFPSTFSSVTTPVSIDAGSVNTTVHRNGYTVSNSSPTTSYVGAVLQTPGNLVVGGTGNFTGAVTFQSGAVFNADSDYRMGATSDIVIQSRVTGDALARFSRTTTGVMQWSNGTDPADTNMYRGGVGLVKSDHKIVATLGLGVGNSAAASTLGTVVKKMQIFDSGGASLGYIAIYDAIT